MSPQSNDARIGVDALLELTGTDREAKAYAFLYAAFSRTTVSKNPVRDALDCLIPFIVPYLNSTARTQLKIDGIKQYLSATYGFDIPLYAIEQLVPSFQRAGYVEYRKGVRAYFAKEQPSTFEIKKQEIEIQFDEVTAELASYACSVGFTVQPPSGTWSNALIKFLKSGNGKASRSYSNVKDAVVNANKIEAAIVGSFIKNLYQKNQAMFQKLLNVFMGVLVV